MKATEVRQRFLDYFERNGHAVRPSSTLVPGDDPTLLFTNAGMVQFKRVFTGDETLPFTRAATSQKCLRVSGKHNDLEEVGVTARHHTFFEMLGNFSFGDYFKRDAIRYAWELFTEEFALPKERLWATVHYSDDEAAKLWEEVAGLPASRIFRLGDKDNFWQMGETGPCGPCSEIHFDMRPEPLRGTELTVDDFVSHSDNGEFLELWNLVFMQFDRSADGTLTPLPAPSIDTGAGLERVTAALQGVDSNYKTDLFLSLIERATEIVGVPYVYATSQGVSYRVLADHARSVAFLLADGVFPTNDGRGYVLRRILRRAVRHAWLLGRREPTLVYVVERVIDVMGEQFPELVHRREHLIRTTRDEEQRFLDTIDTGMERFEQLAPRMTPEPGAARQAPPVIAGADVFKMYDTFGFPLDLTELIARERGYSIDTEGFEVALTEQRERSRADRKAAGAGSTDSIADDWTTLDGDAAQQFVGYSAFEADTDVIAVRRDGTRVGLQLRDNPFYAESGGQVSDRGIVDGDGWRVKVDDVRKVGGRSVVLGELEGNLPATTTGATKLRAHAVVDQARRDTMRNHTATHLMHAALRNVLGTHVVQRGSLVAPDRLRFDFSQPRPMTPDEIRAVEDQVNEAILRDIDVNTEEKPYADALALGAMALFGEKYGDVVRVVMVPEVSLELCGGTHVRHTGDIGMFRITHEGGVASGVRRVEAVTGRAAYRRVVERDTLIADAAAALKTPADNLLRKVEQLLEENRELRKAAERTRAAGSADVVTGLVNGAEDVAGRKVIAREIEVSSADELRTVAEQLRDKLGSGVAVLAARVGERVSLIAVATDDMVNSGVRADALLREVAKRTGGTGGGRPHIAQGGVGDANALADALQAVSGIVRSVLTPG